MYVLDTQKNINYLVYIGDLKKMITVEFVSTLQNMYMFGYMGRFQYSRSTKTGSDQPL